MDDLCLVDGLRARKEEYLNALINSYGKLIYGVIGSVTEKSNAKNDIDEIFYEVLLKIWDYIENYDAEKGRFRNFIISIAKYTAIDYIRKTTKKKECYLDELKLENVVDKEDSYKEMLEKDSFNEIVKTLSKEDRDIFYRVYYLEEDISDIAKIIGKKTNYIYARLSRGRKKLRRNMEVNFYE